MAVNDIDDREYVLSAMRECDATGKATFLASYGFGAATRYQVWHNGKMYDPKSIIGVAHKYARPDIGPLRHHQFSGGPETNETLRKLGFTVLPLGQEPGTERTSDELEVGRVYTRAELIDQFNITDATINTGIFHVPSTVSLWLFVTEEATPDRTQYLNKFDGEVLYWQGQTLGRKDQAIIGHRADGVELLVFYRKSKRQHSGAGFQYLGSFEYASHSNGPPTNFILTKVAAEGTPDDVEGDIALTTARRDIPETTKKALIDSRRGQGRFKADAFRLEPKCRVTGVGIWRHLRASHIKPWGASTDAERLDGNNGLMLAPHIDHLFDQGFISFEDDGTLLISAELDEVIVVSWGICLTQPPKPFTAEQAAYLSYHREFKFRK